MHKPLTRQIGNGRLLAVLSFILRIIDRVPRQVISMNSATAHRRERWR